MESSARHERFNPKGGVTFPISTFTVVIVPKCTPLTPACATSGIRIGVRIRMFENTSRNMPEASPVRLTKAMVAVGDNPAVASGSTSERVMPVTVNIHEKTLAAPTMIGCAQW